MPKPVALYASASSTFSIRRRDDPGFDRQIGSTTDRCNRHSKGLQLRDLGTRE
jgi:hypothetical protein